MPIAIDDLDAAFLDKVNSVIDACAHDGITMVPYAGLRTPFSQAKLWRQSRSTAQVNDRIASLKADGAEFLAHCIASVGPQHGGHVTNAIPGYSWHQWGEAVDCYWLREGKAEWDIDLDGPDNGYRVYAEIATQAGLVAGGYWQSLKDWPHLQLRKASHPAAAGLSVTEIDAAMEHRFGAA